MRIFLFFIILVLSQNTFCLADDINFSVNDIKKEYAGVPYEQTINSTKPSVLVFVTSNDILTILNLYPIIEYIYKEYKNDYNFTIINTAHDNNKELIRKFNLPRLPAIYIKGAKDKNFTFIERRYYRRKALKRILNEY